MGTGRIIDTNSPLCFIFRMENSTLINILHQKSRPACNTTQTLELASALCAEAATACRSWECGGEAGAVTETAGAARAVGSIAIEAVVTDEPWDLNTDEPVSRRARLAYAAWFALLAGTDEHGTSPDLDCAATLFNGAAEG